MPVDPITVRLVTEGDRAALQAREAPPEAQSALDRLAVQQTEDHLLAIAEQSGTLLGFCALNCDPGNELCPELKSLWVYPEFRRLGAGRALTRFLEDLARERDFVEVFLRVDPENAAAIPMYIGLDYSPTGDHQIVEQEWLDDTGVTQHAERHYAVYRKSLRAHH